MSLKISSLPKPDGAPFNCSVDKRMGTWPYVYRCSNKAVGLLTEASLREIESKVSVGGRLICQECFDGINKEVSL